MLERAILTLKGASEEKPWMTAKTLSKKLKLPDHSHLEKCLIDYVTSENGVSPEIRYSNLPSRESLSILWGHSNLVGSKPLQNLTKDNIAHPIPSTPTLIQDKLEEDGVDSTTSVSYLFFSHSHKDFEPVLEISDKLLQKDIPIWLAETHIQQGEYIHEEIICAFQKSVGLLLYLSNNALASRWTGKELSQAACRKMPIYVIVEDKDIVFSDFIDAIQNKDSSGFTSKSATLFYDTFVSLSDDEKANVRFFSSNECVNNIETLLKEISMGKKSHV